MKELPNASKNTTFLPQCLQFSGAYANLSSLYGYSDLVIETVEYDNQSYHLYAQCSLDYGNCPYCGYRSNKVHSRYFRTITDLSILGRPVVMMLEMRKFFCYNLNCEKKTFAEQPGDEVFRYRRRTRRCEMMVAQHGITVSSETTRKLLKSLGVGISGDTVLRDLHRMLIPKHEEVTRIGVDDWAFRKGVTYGSIIVNLNTGAVIDMLGDRNVESFRVWLDTHSEVFLVSRDRSTDYTAAIAGTGRDIVEIADRFHLYKNMSNCVTKVISSHYGDYRKLVRPEETEEAENEEETEKAKEIKKTKEPRKTDSRQVMFNEVKELQSAGLPITRIAHTLGIARQTIRKYLKYETLPRRASKEQIPYHQYDSYVEDEYQHGKDLKKVFRELKNKGFEGSQTPFYDHYRYLSDGHHGYRSKNDVERMNASPRTKREPLMPIRQIAQIVDKSIRKKKMQNEENGLVEKMRTFNWFKEIYVATASFYGIIMGDDTLALDVWLKAYGRSSIAELRTFTYGINMDLNAVRNAITYDTSNGVVEGFVNKLKSVKRTMYGRASLELLRRKMVFSNLAFN